jgi:serine/threonine protein kinase
MEAYAAGKLDVNEAAAVRLHLPHCPACRRFLEDLLNSPQSTVASPGQLGGLCPDELTTAEAREEPGESSTEEIASLFSLKLLSPLQKPGAIGRLGAYEVQGLLGQGGMGIVLKAFDTALHRTVAIKVLSPKLATSQKAHRRFLREARAAAGINHPNVVTIHAVEEQASLPYLVMEYVPGLTLRERMKSPEPFELSALVQIASQTAAGLAAAHEHGVIHRDIKPANIMLESGTERVKITDFGLALVAMDVTEITSAEHVVGTPAYMSPEQAAGERLDPRSDLFGLGCVIYALVAGKSPFHGVHALEIARKLADFVPRPLHEVDPRVPHSLSNLVRRLLEKSPNARYQTAAEVRDLLQRHLGQPSQWGSSVQSLGNLGPHAGGSTSRWKVLGIAAGLLLLLVAGIVALSPELRSRLRGGGETAVLSARLLKVARNGEADCRTIREALSRAGPGSTILVIDDATYWESVVVDNPDRWRGVTLESTRGAVIACREGPFAALIIKNTADVTVRGFGIHAAINQHAVCVFGDVPGLTLDRLDFRQPADSQWACIYFAEGARGKPGRPISLRQSAIETGKFGLMVGNQDDGGAEHIEVTDNRFRGAGTHVIVKLPANGVLFRGNVLVDGKGIVLEPTAAAEQSKRLEIINNTFFRTDCWFNLAGNCAIEDAVLCNNLLLEVNRIEVRGLSLAELAGVWSFRNNWWEQGDGVDLELARLVAKMHPSISVLSRDRESAGFLRPPAGSPLLTSGAGGKWPALVGALLPPEPGNR